MLKHSRSNFMAQSRCAWLFAMVVLAGGLLSGCASNSAVNPDDPYESFNRKVFDLNLTLDRNFAKPVAEGYVAVVPEPARDGVHNFLTNLNQPIVFVNSILQGEPYAAADTFSRFLIDSSVGLGGLIDVASMMGVPSHSTDFGTTLGRWGVDQGPFLMLPLLGPSTPRDLTGKAVDIAFDPLTYIHWRSSLYYDYAGGFLGLVDLRAQNLGQIESLEETSVDFYATTRNLYLQYRAAQMNQGQPNIENLPNF